MAYRNKRRRKKKAAAYIAATLFIVSLIVVLAIMINITSNLPEITETQPNTSSQTPIESSASQTAKQTQTLPQTSKETAEPPKTTTEPPKTTTEPPKTTTEPPKTTTEPPKTTTEAPPETGSSGEWTKPEFTGIDSIIAFSNTLGVSETLTGFSLDGLYPDTLLKKTSDAGASYKDETLYIGDSTTLGLKTWKQHPNNMVFGFGSLTPETACTLKVTLPDGTTDTVAEGVKKVQPKRIVITLGTNGVALFAEKTFLQWYGKFVDQIKAACPEAEIIIQSIMPVTESYNNKMKKLVNTRINRYNLLLLGLAEYKGVYFLNTAEVLKNSAGHFDDALTSDEGVHHNQESYELWFKYLREHSAALQ